MSAREALTRAIDTLQDWGEGFHEVPTTDALARLLDALPTAEEALDWLGGNGAVSPNAIRHEIVTFASVLWDPNA